MLDTFQGLPVHALVVHATVVVLPLAAVSVALAAILPRFRAWAGPLPAIAAVISLVLVPISTMSGENLYDRIKQFGGEQPLIEDHERLAEMLIWIVIPFAVLAVLGYVLHRRGAGKAVLLTVSVLSVVAAGAVAVDVALIGHAGSKAVWSDTVNNTEP
jgi:hypothetical protein